MPFDPGSAAPPSHLWALREDVLVEDESDHLVIVTSWGEVAIDGVGDVVRASLRRMCLGAVSLENVLGRQPEPGGEPRPNWPEWAELWQVLDMISGSVVRSFGLGDGESPLLSAVPVTRSAKLALPEVTPDRPVRLSRFAAIRPHDGNLLVESPLAPYHVVLHRQLAATVATALSAATSVGEVAARLNVPEPVVTGLVAYLVGTGIAVLGERPTARGDGRFPEDTDPVLVRWSHHELLFHTRSRMGRHVGPTGAVYPWADRVPSPALVKMIRHGRRFALYRPDIADLVATDPPLTEVLENANLCDDLTERELSAEQLGELLFRAARIRSVTSGSTGVDTRYDTSDRPYVSDHGLYELELYVSVHKCAGMPRGIYHYDPEHHELTLVNDSEPELNELLDSARIAARAPAPPPMLLTLTARVVRTSWMYEGIGYSMALTHVGALQQTLCLVANAMGLAACAPTVDPGDITNNALRLDWPAEVGIGEFLVG